VVYDGMEHPIAGVRDEIEFLCGGMDKRDELGNVEDDRFLTGK
jgi:hypothetical protein